MTHFIVNDKHISLFLPRNDDLLNLVLDLDQTLINTEVKRNDTSRKKFFDRIILNRICRDNFIVQHKHNLIHSSKLFEYNVNEDRFVVHARKGIFMFLEELSRHFNIYIYTNALSSYAHKICKKIELGLGKNVFVGIISRLNLQSSQMKYVNIFPYLHESNTIIIDDRVDVWDSKMYNNIIQIREYCHTPSIKHFLDGDLILLKNLILAHVLNNKISIIDSVQQILLNYRGYISESTK
jgi:TFIIF-interacting CTD phosphatase-like protein